MYKQKGCSPVFGVIPKWGFPKIRGTFLGVPIIRIIIFWGLYWGPCILGNYQMSSMLFGDTMASCTAVRSVTAKPITFWTHLSATDIKTHVSPPKSTKRQFVCQHKFFWSLQRAIGQQFEASDSSNLPHLPGTGWSEDIQACSFCATLLNFVQVPDKIHRSCQMAQLLPKPVLLEKLNSCQKILTDLSSIIVRL